MATLRVKAKWTVPGAGTAYSVMHFGTQSGSTPVQAEAQECYGLTRTFFDSVKSTLPNVVKIDVLNEVEEIQVANGNLIGVWPVTAGPQIVGTAASTAGWAAAAGAVVSWSTAGIRNGRRVRGRTFLVPLSNEVWDVDGTIKSVPLTAITNAANTFRTTVGSVQPSIWGRPSSPGATDGVLHSITAHRVPDMSAVLRSRRS